jgi:xylulokinase
VTQRWVVGHDVGTSGNKTVLCDLDGRVVATAYEPYPLVRPRPGWVEQDPDLITAAVLTGSRAVVEQSGTHADEVLAVGLSGQMFNAVAIGADGKALMPMLSWLDVRSAPQAEAIERGFDLDAQFERYGNVFTAKDIVPKILWIRDARPDVWRRAAAFVDCKDYVNARLTGQIATDYAGASATFVFDVRDHRWNDDIALELGLPRERLPPTRQATAVLGGLTAECAPAAGLRPGTPIVVGAGDVPAGQLGAGAAQPGETHLSLGTACYFGVTLASPLSDPGRRLGVLCHVDPQRWLLWTEMETGGGAIAWWREVLGGATGAGPLAGADIDRLAGAVSPQDVDLLFAPWLTGERVPLWDHDARGAFVGLSIHHGPGHLARAIIEGLAYQLRSALEYAEAFGQNIGEIRVIGGAGLGEVLPRVLADVLGRQLTIVADPQSAAARGAAMCALAGVAGRDLDRLASATTIARHIVPDARHRPLYDDRYEVFKHLHDALAGTTRMLLRTDHQ